MYIYAYWGAGVLTYLLFVLLYRRTGIEPRMLNRVWFPGGIEKLLVLIFAWPILAVLSIVVWIGEFLHLVSKRKEAIARAAAQANPYHALSDEELRLRQRKALEDLESLKSKG
jgi:hypothetical protein